MAISGATFDMQYMSHAGVGDHQQTLNLLQKTQREAKDPQLKALAVKMIPVVQVTWPKPITSRRRPNTEYCKVVRAGMH
jgi:predicted outer membrane protein